MLRRLCWLGLLLHAVPGGAQQGAPRAAARAAGASAAVAADASAAADAAPATVSVCQSFQVGSGERLAAQAARFAAFAPSALPTHKLVATPAPDPAALRAVAAAPPLPGCDTARETAPPSGGDFSAFGGASVWDSFSNAAPPASDPSIEYYGGSVCLGSPGPPRVHLLWYGDWAAHPATTLLPQLVQYASGT